MVLLLASFFLLGAGLDDLFHLFIMHFRLDLHVLSVFFLLLLELNSSFLDFFLTSFKLMVQLSKSFFITFSGLFEFLLLLMSFQIGLFFLLFIKLLHHPYTFLSFLIHFLLATNHLLLLFL